MPGSADLRALANIAFVSTALMLPRPICARFVERTCSAASRPSCSTVQRKPEPRTIVHESSGERSGWQPSSAAISTSTKRVGLLQQIRAYGSAFADESLDRLKERIACIETINRLKPNGEHASIKKLRERARLLEGGTP